MASAYDIFGPDGVITVGPVVALPTGPRGRGIQSFSYDSATSALVAHMTDGTDENASLPIGSGGGGLTGGDPTTTVPLSQDVITYVQQQLAPIKTVDTTQTNRLDAIDKSVADVIATEATDAELAKAIADLSIASYLKSADAANIYLSQDAAKASYAPLAHKHVIADVTGLQAALDTKIDKPAGATNGQQLTFDGTNWIATTPAAAADLSAYALKTDLTTYALKTDLSTKIDKPATAVNGNVLTFNGTAWVAAAPASAPDLTPYVTKTTADNTYIPKTAYTAKGDLLVGTGGGTYAVLPGGVRTNPVRLTLDAGGSPVWTTLPAQTIPWSMAGTVAVRTGTGRYYNDLGHNRVITTLRASAGTAPAGSVLTVAVKVDGTQVGTVSIAAAANTAVTTGLSAAFNTGSYVSVDVTAVGSTTAGADLVVGVTHRGA